MRVLIVIHADGLVESFSSSDVQVRIVNQIKTTSEAQESLARKILFNDLPWNWRKLVESCWARNIRSGHVGDCQTAVGRQHSDAIGRLYVALDALKAALETEGATT